jgi:FtsZ-binding cell division protein ZapB
MLESLWESDAVVERQREEPAAEPVLEPSEESSAVALSADEFTALEVRILRAVEVVKRERQARAVAEERAARAEAELHEAAPQMESLKQEVSALREEREQVRQRVERLLTQLDALEV